MEAMIVWTANVSRCQYLQYLGATVVDNAETAMGVDAAVRLDAVDALSLLIIRRTPSTAAPSVVDRVVRRPHEHVRLTLVHSHGSLVLKTCGLRLQDTRRNQRRSAEFFSINVPGRGHFQLGLADFWLLYWVVFAIIVCLSLVP